MKRRRFLRTVVAGVTTGMAGCGQSTAPADRVTNATGTRSTKTETTSTDTGARLPDEVGLETLARGLRAPTAVAFAPEADRRYIAEQGGRIHVHESGSLRDAPFLDLRNAVETGSEKGLLGVALHPDFAGNRRLFVRYSAPRREGTPSSYSHTFVLSEFKATADGQRVRRDSERTVLEIPEPQGNHNAGSVLFGPDGYLYVGVGDGGAAADQGTGHASDWYDAVDGGNGQDVTENLLGSVLRIDVNGESGDRPYGVPEDNPLVGETGRDEMFAWGLRNPWRMSFDRTDFFVADVGQSRYEEVNLVEKGGNYGWNVREGAHCFGTKNCPDTTPTGVRGGEPLVDPVVEYAHSGNPGGVSVIGGHVYRGSTLPGLRGAYVFGDLQARGRLFVATRSKNSRWPIGVVKATGGSLDRILSFGRDDAGEVYVLGTAGGDGKFHRIVPAG